MHIERESDKFNLFLKHTHIYWHTRTHIYRHTRTNTYKHVFSLSISLLHTHAHVALLCMPLIFYFLTTAVEKAFRKILASHNGTIIIDIDVAATTIIIIIIF